MKKYLISAIVFVFLVLNVSAANAVLVGTAVEPLRMPQGARPLGMGGAYVGIADDGATLYFNPAGISRAERMHLTIGDPKNFAVAAILPTKYGMLGLGACAFGFDNMTVPPGVMSYSSNAILVAYSPSAKAFQDYLPQLATMPAFKEISWGISLKMLLNQSVRRTGQADNASTGWNIDIGGLYGLNHWADLGFCWYNFLPGGFLSAGQFNWNNGELETMPTRLKVGVGMRVRGKMASLYQTPDRLLVGFDMSMGMSGGPLLFNLGAEWEPQENVILRAGLDQDVAEEGASLAVATGLSLGAGTRFSGWRIDWAYHPRPRTGEINLFSLTYVGLGAEERARRVEEARLEREEIESLRREKEKQLLPVRIVRPITITAPPNNMMTQDDRTTVKGKAKRGVTVLVNGVEAIIDKNMEFSVAIPLNMGKNLIEIVALYELRSGSRKDVAQRSVLRKAKIEKIKIAIPKVPVKATAEEKKKIEKEIEQKEEQKKQIETLATLGIIEVAPEEEFAAEAQISRAELAMWLVKARGLAVPEVFEDVFFDVPYDDPFAPFIKAAVDAKLMSPYPDGTFKPDGGIPELEGERILKRFDQLK